MATHTQAVNQYIKVQEQLGNEVVAKKVTGTKCLVDIVVKDKDLDRYIFIDVVLGSQESPNYNRDEHVVVAEKWLKTKGIEGVQVCFDLARFTENEDNSLYSATIENWL